MTSCPLCGSRDLDEFEDGTGWLCFGCWRNVFHEDFEHDHDHDREEEEVAA